MEDKGITITYETLFEILRREKDRLELQKLDISFYDDVISYIQEKKALLDGKGQQQLFSEDEKIKTEKQLINIRKILRELYERREKKIMNMAVDKSRTQSDLIDTSSLLETEKTLFDNLVNVLDAFRENILIKVLNAEPVAAVQQQPVNITGEEPTPIAQKQSSDKPTKLIRFKLAVPKFVGLDGEEFGPFEEEDIASLPREIAEVLIRKERPDEIQEA